MTADPGTPAESPEPPRPAGGGLLRTPLRGGAVLGFALAALAVGAMSWAEGGADEEARRARAVLQAGAFLALVGVLGFYARRVIASTIEGDREVRWLDDPLDRTTWVQDVGSFAVVLVFTLAPAAVLVWLAERTGMPGWVVAAAGVAGIAAAAAHLPFALASTVLRDGPLGAAWGGAVRAWRANAPAARRAAAPAAAFLVLFAASFAVAAWLVPGMSSGKAALDHTAGRDAGRAAVFVVRVAAVWSAFCAFRAAGLVARDVPEIREVIE